MVEFVGLLTVNSFSKKSPIDVWQGPRYDFASLLLNLNSLRILIKVYSYTTFRIDFSAAIPFCLLKWSFWKKVISSYKENLLSAKRSWFATKSEVYIFSKQKWIDTKLIWENWYDSVRKSSNFSHGPLKNT